jgi:hypothetical protein
MSAKMNLTFEQGATFRKTITWKTGTPATPVDLTGCTARMHARDKVTDAAPLLELTTENGRISLGGVLGTISFLVSAVDTSAITWAKAVYDLEVIAVDGTVTRLVHGSIEVSKEVTR